jgi:hypothetical protein
MHTIPLLVLLYPLLTTARLLPADVTAAMDSDPYVQVLTVTETVTKLANPPSTVFVTPEPALTISSEVFVTAKLQAGGRIDPSPLMVPLEPSERNFFGTLAGGKDLDYTRFWKKGLGYRSDVVRRDWETQTEVIRSSALVLQTFSLRQEIGCGGGLCRRRNAVICAYPFA